MLVYNLIYLIFCFILYFYILRGSRILIIFFIYYKNDINKICKYLLILVIVCWDSGKFIFYIFWIWKIFFFILDKSMYFFKLVFFLLVMKKKMDEVILDIILMDLEVRGKIWIFIEEFRRRRSLVCFVFEEKMRNKNF